MTIVPIPSADLDAAEVAWFAAAVLGRLRHLGVPDGDLRSSWEHCRHRDARRGARLSQHPVPLVLSGRAGHAVLRRRAARRSPKRSTSSPRSAAARCSRSMLARTVATLDHMLKGRLTLNVISSDFPGEMADSAFRYRAAMRWWKSCARPGRATRSTTRARSTRFKGLSTDPARPYQQNGGPLLYFGGYSPDALELCGAQCDVYLMWPETTGACWPTDARRARPRRGAWPARSTTACAST